MTGEDFRKAPCRPGFDRQTGQDREDESLFGIAARGVARQTIGDYVGKEAADKIAMTVTDYFAEGPSLTVNGKTVLRYYLDPSGEPYEESISKRKLTPTANKFTAKQYYNGKHGSIHVKGRDKLDVHVRSNDGSVDAAFTIAAPTDANVSEQHGVVAITASCRNARKCEGWSHFSCYR